MAIGIDIDLDRLANEVIALGDQRLADIDSAMTAACNSVAVLTMSGWEGKSKEAFMMKFTTFKKDMRIFYENLSSFQGALRNTCSKGDAVFDSAATLAGKL